MSKSIPFQYALVQYGHDLVTDEWLNVGLAIYSGEHRYFRCELLLKYQRLTQAFPGADGEFYKRYMVNLQTSLTQLTLSVGRDQLSFMATPHQLEGLLASVMTPDDVSVRFGEIRGGLADDLDDTFEEMYQRLVEHYVEAAPEERRSDADILTSLRRTLREADLITKLPSRKIQTPLDELEFPHAWKNGKWNVIQPLSLDAKRPETIRRKAKEVLGSATMLGQASDAATLFVVLGRPQGLEYDVQRAYRKARSALEGVSNSLPLEVVDEDNTGPLIKRIREDIEAHS
jgi:Protein of unknown function (DUF3037)